MLQGNVGVERQHENWAHVSEAGRLTKASGDETMVHRDSLGVIMPVIGLGLSTGDWDRPTSDSVKKAVDQGATKSLAAIVDAAQTIPEPIDAETLVPLPFRKPELTTGMKQELLSGDAAFFHLFLYDCCDEDGDVVEVLINGASFAIVPITHKGATLSVPFLPGQGNSIDLRGVRDGGGGITVAFETSQGHSFCRALTEGEVQHIGVAIK